MCRYELIPDRMKQTVAGMKWHVWVWINTFKVWNDNCRYEIIRVGMKCFFGMKLYHVWTGYDDIPYGKSFSHVFSWCAPLWWFLLLRITDLRAPQESPRIWFPSSAVLAWSFRGQSLEAVARVHTSRGRLFSPALPPWTPAKSFETLSVITRVNTIFMTSQ